MHNILKIIFLIVLIIICTGFSESPSGEKLDNLQKLFKQNLPKGVVYTQVPRGLIISVDESVFFNDCDYRIKEEALYVLDKIAYILNNLPNFCVIEDHLQKDVCSNGLENWELSMMRSANVVDYLLKCGKVPQEQLFDIGYGEFMPFKDNVNPNLSVLNNRLDFVIIDYTAKR